MDNQGILTEFPPDHRPYTDKYFLRTNQILRAEGINPRISMNVFTRGDGVVAGLDNAVNVLTRYSDIKKNGGEAWVTRASRYETKTPLMVIKAHAQDIVELETMYLGVLSHAISQANGVPFPEPAEITAKVRRLADIYGEIPITYFGARHYHWSLDRMIAEAALAGGAVQTSTDNGSALIGKLGSGTTPHVLSVILSTIYGRDRATRATAELFDRHISAEVPRVTLVDTFNRELSDSLMVADYFGTRPNLMRVDTCGENVGEGGSLYEGRVAKDPTYRTGTGVTIELVTNLRKTLIQHGFGDYTNTILSSGFGDEDKARAFVDAHRTFKERTGYSLFSGVGIGEVFRAIFCTSDVFEVDGRPVSKKGREIGSVDYQMMERVV